MGQELGDLRISILEGRYEDALAIVDELEGMSKQAIIRNIESFLVRLLVHLIKNQVEERLTNSWAVYIVDSVRQIKKLNLKYNKRSYYINIDQWSEFLEDAFQAAIRLASTEILGGNLKPKQILSRVSQEKLMQIAQDLLALTYSYDSKDLPGQVDQFLSSLPGGQEWFEEE
ncbi:protein of unknown function DUF29 [Gloeothece citriformis PCC 7424]|uniref:DUF29 domain-containing protein n=1 Tax=Gloeothece citriformis (strain PCC 7424) TaxID=65393 RepID=B7KLM3_GLOC7|nr:DUF29 family protein [Gloeothece citriformis]ACK72595.1 protein of unknown function DUF29 [Gloeothece citriformis PCC 7424]